MLDEWLDGVLDWLYPPRCMSCDSLLPMRGAGVEAFPRNCTEEQAAGGGKWFCRECWPLLEWIGEPVCEKCGRPVEAEKMVCAECNGKHFHFERNFSVFVYDDAVKDIVHKFKYHGHPGYGKGLGAIMVQRLGDKVFHGIDYIVPVPMHPGKIRRRGYNQAAILAKAISRHTGVPIRDGLLVRTRDTKPQSSLTTKAREHNIKDAFEISKKNQISAKKIIVVDDIYTTGSTLSACSGVFMRNGADKVYGVTLSAALREHRAR